MKGIYAELKILYKLMDLEGYVPDISFWAHKRKLYSDTISKKLAIPFRLTEGNNTLTPLARNWPLLLSSVKEIIL